MGMLNITDPRLCGYGPAGFFASYSIDGVEFETCYGAEYNYEGMRLLTETPIPVDELQVRLALGPYDVVYRARKVWQDAFPVEDERWHMSGLRFLSARIDKSR